MAEIIKRNWDLTLALVIGLILTVMGLAGISLPFHKSTLAATATVDVTATVLPWLTFSSDQSAVTLYPDLVNAAGTAQTGSSSSIILRAGTNAANGWQITIGGKYDGLCHNVATGTVPCSTSSVNLIDSVGLTATTSINPGVTGYGANATWTISGAAVQTYYLGWNSTNTGAIATSTAQVFINKGSGNASSSVANVKIYAAAPITQKPGNYYDTITFTATTIP